MVKVFFKNQLCHIFVYGTCQLYALALHCTARSIQVSDILPLIANAWGKI
jgi:hypothetical protein